MCQRTERTLTVVCQPVRDERLASLFKEGFWSVFGIAGGNASGQVTIYPDSMQFCCTHSLDCAYRWKTNHDYEQLLASCRASIQSYASIFLGTVANSHPPFLSSVSSSRNQAGKILSRDTPVSSMQLPAFLTGMLVPEIDRSTCRGRISRTGSQWEGRALCLGERTKKKREC